MTSSCVYYYPGSHLLVVAARLEILIYGIAQHVSTSSIIRPYDVDTITTTTTTTTLVELAHTASYRVLVLRWLLLLLLVLLLVLPSSSTLVCDVLVL